MRTIADVKVGDRLPELAYDVTATTVVLGALATRDWRPMHHDVDFAVNRNGIRNIFLNTPNQQAWFERYLTDWTGPRGRLGRMRFRMLTSVFPDDRMVFAGTVDDVSTDGTGCGWAAVAVQLKVTSLRGSNAAVDTVATSCSARIALPTTEDDNPWRRRGDDWRP
jgi:acyl dehydratase